MTTTKLLHLVNLGVLPRYLFQALKPHQIEVAPSIIRSLASHWWPIGILPAHSHWDSWSWPQNEGAFRRGKVILPCAGFSPSLMRRIINLENPTKPIGHLQYRMPKCLLRWFLPCPSGQSCLENLPEGDELRVRTFPLPVPAPQQLGARWVFFSWHP